MIRITLDYILTRPVVRGMLKPNLKIPKGLGLFLTGNSALRQTVPYVGNVPQVLRCGYLQDG